MNKVRIGLIGMVALALCLQAGEKVLIEDALDGKTLGEQHGGTFKDGAFFPGKGEGHVLYKLPESVGEGELSFEVKGMNPAKVDKKEHGFACMYDGKKMAEPIQYSPEFKYNFYRFNMHWRKNRSAVKCVINIATEEKKKQAMDERPMFNLNDGEMEWRQEPTGKSYPFEEEMWYRIRITWSDDKIETSVEELDGSNKVTVWSVKKHLPYAPEEHMIRVGSGPGKYSSALENVQYRNVKLVSTAGE